MIREFDVAEYNGSPIVIYGAGTFGGYALSALKQHGLEPACFCDRDKKGEQYLGYDVYGYEHIGEIEDAAVLLAVGTALWEVADFLEGHNITNLYYIYRFLFEDSRLNQEEFSDNARDIIYFRNLYRFAMEKEQEDEVKLFTLDWVITEKCSLRCRDCSNLMQYYSTPQNYGKEDLQRNLDRVLEVAGRIFDVRVLGGEPFMNPYLPEIMEKYLEDDRVINFTIYTNGTILPNERTLQALRNPKVKCQISNYGEIAKNFHAFVSLMEKEKLRYSVTEISAWQDLGKLEDRHKTEEEIAATFRLCECNNIITLLDDKIYRCPFSAHGRNLEAIPDAEEDRVFLYGSVGYVRRKLRYLLKDKEFDYACGYCSGRNSKLTAIEPAVQSSQPLPYRKISALEGLG